MIPNFYYSYKNYNFHACIYKLKTTNLTFNKRFIASIIKKILQWIILIYIQYLTSRFSSFGLSIIHTKLFELLKQLYNIAYYLSYNKQLNRCKIGSKLSLMLVILLKLLTLSWQHQQRSNITFTTKVMLVNYITLVMQQGNIRGKVITYVLISYICQNLSIQHKLSMFQLINDITYVLIVIKTQDQSF
eukprot:TRINITY_DN7277_c0_g2_i1.p1 TRINITY_DN7277_c0_g2~~TRINITY_DN7277_c0_g2_i1.p1  ORF type:complete len:188 (+),score=-40.28 TRINITY_DN7277_c0_g2_i1:444-1007(+)